jgi:hypothetical protein
MLNLRLILQIPAQNLPNTNRTSDKVKSYNSTFVILRFDFVLLNLALYLLSVAMLANSKS